MLDEVTMSLWESEMCISVMQRAIFQIDISSILNIWVLWSPAGQNFCI